MKQKWFIEDFIVKRYLGSQSSLLILVSNTSTPAKREIWLDLHLKTTASRT